MSDRINCRNCIHFNDLEHRCCLNDGNEIKKECYFILSKRKPKGKDIVIEHLKTKIADLEAKLAESEKKVNYLFDKNAEQLKLWNATASELMIAQRQLAEKEKEIETLKEENERNKAEAESQHKSFIDCFKDKMGLTLYYDNIEKQHNQDKISFCIEQLQCVRNKIPLMSVQEIIDAKIWELTHQHEDKGE